MRSGQKKFAFLLFAIFFVSAGYSFFAHIQPYGDAQAYDRIGWNLARGLGYVEHEENAGNVRADDAIFRIGPAYEFFLAGIYRLFGHHIEVVWIIQAFLRMLTAFLLFMIALLLFSDHQKKERIGFVAAAFFGFFPDFILFNGFLLYETLLLFFSVAAIYYSLRALSQSNTPAFLAKSSFSSAFLSRYIDISRYQDVLLASFFWALAILARPSELLAFLVFPFTLAFTWRFHRQGIFLAGLSFLLPFFLVGGWSLRNSLLYDQPLFTTTAGAYALWVGNNAKASGGYDRPHALRETRTQYHSVELSRASLKNTIAFIKHRPLKFLELQFKKTIIYFSLIRPTGFWPHLQYVPIQRFFTVGMSAFATALLFILGGAGAWMIWTKKNAVLLTFYGFMLAKPLAVIPFYVETRYRYSLYPFLALMAAFFMFNLFSSHRRALRIAAGMIAAFLVITSIDAWYSLDIIVNRLPFLLRALW